MDSSRPSLAMLPPEIVLLSIKPEFAELILAGDKKYEFRKAGLRHGIDLILLYASAPEQKLVGYAKIGEILEASPTRMWDMTRLHGGISRERFREYFKGKKSAYAFRITEVHKFEKGIDPKKIFTNFSPPQSFRYVRLEEVEDLLSAAG